MKKGICCAGNMIVDITYPIETWPKQNELTHITEGIKQLHRRLGLQHHFGPRTARSRSFHSWPPALPGMTPRAISSCRRWENTRISTFPWSSATADTSLYRGHVRTTRRRSAPSSSTRAANAYYGEDDIDWDRLERRYLPHWLHPAAAASGRAGRGIRHKDGDGSCTGRSRPGMKTSIDVVSEAGERFARLVTPALKYTDYCIINELETPADHGRAAARRGRRAARGKHEGRAAEAPRAGRGEVGRHPLPGDSAAAWTRTAITVNLRA